MKLRYFISENSKYNPKGGKAKFGMFIKRGRWMYITHALHPFYNGGILIMEYKPHKNNFVTEESVKTVTGYPTIRDSHLQSWDGGEFSLREVTKEEYDKFLFIEKL